MSTTTKVIFIYSVNSILLVGSALFSVMIFQTLTQVAEMEQKNEVIINQPYLSEQTRAEQKELLARSKILTQTFIQDPNNNIQLIQAIEGLAVNSGIDLEVHLDEKSQQPLGNVSLVPIEFDGNGSWSGFVAFQRALRDSHPGFFIDQMALTNQPGDSVHFSLNYTLLWQGKL